MRRLLVAAALAAMLVLGLVIGAWADIPDATPSTPDPSHTLFLCYSPVPQPMKPVYLLDKSQGNCTGGTVQVKAVPAVP